MQDRVAAAMRPVDTITVATCYYYPVASLLLLMSCGLCVCLSVGHDC